MEKISNEQVVELLTDASSTIRSQAEKIASLEEELAAKNVRERAEKVAASMQGKGLRLDTSREELVEQLQKEAAAGRLDSIEQAVEMVGPDMGTKLARVNDNNTNDQGSSSGSALEQFILQ